MENKELNLNDFVAFLLKTNEEIQNKINIDIKNKEGLSNLKIQKLLSFIEASFLVKFKSKLFTNDYQAWDYGPVIPELYKILSKKFGRNTFFYNEYKKENNCNPENIKKHLTNEEFTYIKDSFIYFNKYSPFEIVALSHIDGPWKEVSKNEIISKEKMLSLFKESSKKWAIL